MENFESLNAIVDEFQIKYSTLSIFSIDSSYQLGKEFTPASVQIIQSQIYKSTDIKFESKNDAFCSIFSDNMNPGDSSFSSTSVTGEDKKLSFESDMLSSDFENDVLQPILTSSLSD